MSLRVDSHQHFWRYESVEYGWIDDSMAKLRRDFLPPDLRPLLDASRFDGCIAVQARQTLAETRFLLDLAAHHAWILGVVGWVDLQSPDVGSQLDEFAANPRLVGVRHIAQAEPDPRFLVSPAFVRGVAALSARDLTYDLLVYPHQLGSAVELSALFPAQRFVLDHCGKPDLRSVDGNSGARREWTKQLRALARLPNTFCKLSGLATEAPWNSWQLATVRPALDEALAAFGPQRVMFGSDWPVCLCATEHGRWADLVQGYAASWSEADRAALFGGTAQRAYPGLAGRDGRR